jgi:methanogenic corrinoid protein MtbC1
MPNDEWDSLGIEELRKRLLDAVLLADLTTARHILQASEQSADLGRIVTDLLEPMLEIIGREWEQDKLSLAQGYVAAKIAREVLERANTLNPASDAPPPGGAKIAVIGNIEDDYHALGRTMVVTFLKSAGWHVHDLGNDVPAADFVQHAVQLGAKVIGVSAMTHTTAANIRLVRDEIDRKGLTGRIQLAVGGAVFNLRPDLLAEVGGDGTARNALAAPKLFEDLWQRATELESR